MKLIIKFLLIIFTIIITVFIYFFFKNNFLYFAVGNSMEPTFSGCTLVIANTIFIAEEISKGEIVVINILGVEEFINTGYDKMSHRVYDNRLDLQRIVTRGDNDDIYTYPSQVDGMFEYDRVIGVVKYYYNLPDKVCNIRNF